MKMLQLVEEIIFEGFLIKKKELFIQDKDKVCYTFYEVKYVFDSLIEYYKEYKSELTNTSSLSLEISLPNYKIYLYWNVEDCQTIQVDVNFIISERTEDAILNLRYDIDPKNIFNPTEEIIYDIQQAIKDYEEEQINEGFLLSKKTKFTAEEWLERLLNELTTETFGRNIKFIDEDNYDYFYYESDFDTLYVDYDKVWKILANQYKLPTEEIENLIQKLIKNKYNLEVGIIT
jgi:hypothetical protein